VGAAPATEISAETITTALAPGVEKVGATRVFFYRRLIILTNAKHAGDAHADHEANHFLLLLRAQVLLPWNSRFRPCRDRGWMAVACPCCSLAGAIERLL
jgi:hypothetical protein